MRSHNRANGPNLMVRAIDVMVVNKTLPEEVIFEI